MAITQTGSIYKGFTFDGINSKTYGVYISGAAVYNAPERDVTMIEIPGRNGAFAMDNGRFANIEVTYPAGLFGDTESDFAQGISDLRNALASRKGYCVLTDEYNPSEYRLAVYRSGLDVDPASLEAGEFNIVFDCMPQRYLDSGKSAQSVVSGGSLNNPTLFDSHPLIQVEGYGDIDINGYTTNVNNGALGVIPLCGYSFARTNNKAKKYYLKNMSHLNTGDTISFGQGFSISFSFAVNGGTLIGPGGVGFNVPSTLSGVGTATPYILEDGETGAVNINVKFDPLHFSYGTFDTRYADLIIPAAFYVGGVSTVEDFSAGLQVNYVTNSYILIQITPTNTSHLIYLDGISLTIPGISGNSTKTISSETLNIDMETGEAYIVSLSENVPANNNVSIGSQFARLSPGTNTITYSNTFTDFKIVPRWWKV